MAKYKLRALESWVTVVPASEMIFRHLITGEEVGKRLPVPEIRMATEKGSIAVVSNKKELKKLLDTGKWELVS